MESCFEDEEHPQDWAGPELLNGEVATKLRDVGIEAVIDSREGLPAVYFPVPGGYGQWNDWGEFTINGLARYVEGEGEPVEIVKDLRDLALIAGLALHWSRSRAPGE